MMEVVEAKSGKNGKGLNVFAFFALFAFFVSPIFTIKKSVFRKCPDTRFSVDKEAQLKTEFSFCFWASRSDVPDNATRDNRGSFCNLPKIALFCQILQSHNFAKLRQIRQKGERPPLPPSIVFSGESG
jgi:hypothetical protein